MTVDIRPATVDDAEAITEIVRARVRDIGWGTGLQVSRWVDQHYPVDALRIKISNPNNRVWVGCAGGVVVGSVRLQLNGGDVGGLYVAEAMAGRDVGPQLRHTAPLTADTADLDGVAMSVAAANQGMLRLAGRSGH